MECIFSKNYKLGQRLIAGLCLLSYLCLASILYAQQPTDKEPPLVSATVPAEKPVEKQDAKLDFEFGKGMTVTSGDGKSDMNLRFRFQTRFTQTEVPPDQPYESSEAQIRRARIAIKGHALGKHWRYYIQFGFSSQDMEKDRPVPLRNAELTFEKFRDAHITIGQMKTPYNRQRIISSGAQQFVERSISNNELNTDRDVGVMLSSSDFLGLNLFSYSAGAYGGDGRNRNSTASGIMGIGKFSIQPLGVFKERSEVDFSRSKVPLLKISAMGGYNKNSNRKLSTFGDVYDFARFDFTHYGTEALLFWQGISLSAEYLVRQADTLYKEKMVGAVLKKEYSRSAQGYMAQLAYLFPFNFETALRYAEYRPVGDTDPSLIYTVERGFALSYYLLEHNLKFQTDYMYLTGEIAAKGEAHQVRLQMQLFI